MPLGVLVGVAELLAVAEGLAVAVLDGVAEGVAVVEGVGVAEGAIPAGEGTGPGADEPDTAITIPATIAAMPAAAPPAPRRSGQAEARGSPDAGPAPAEGAFSEGCSDTGGILPSSGSGPANPRNIIHCGSAMPSAALAAVLSSSDRGQRPR